MSWSFATTGENWNFSEEKIVARIKHGENDFVVVSDMPQRKGKVAVRLVKNNVAVGAAMYIPAPAIVKLQATGAET